MIGVARLLRLALRRDRVSIAVWTVTLGSLPWLTYFAYEQLYSPQSRAALAASVSGSTGLWAIYGRPFDLTTSGGFTVWRDGALLALAVGLMASFTVVRHTRAEEESGRAETLLAGAVTRTGVLAAALLAAVGTSFLIGCAATTGLLLMGAPLAGSVLFGDSLAATGWVFAGASAVACQFAGFGRTANMLGCLVVGVAFLARAVGDGGTSTSWLTWVSPLGWAENAQPFADDNWPALVLPLAAGAVLSAVAAQLARGRDIGHGLITRDRRSDDTGRVAGPWSLAGYLQRGSVLAWTIGTAVCGAVFGSLTGAIVDLLEADAGSAATMQALGGSSSLATAYASEMLTVLSLGAAACGVQGVLHLHLEEMQGRLGWALAAGRSRAEWSGSHLLLAGAGSAVALLAGAAAFAVGSSRSTAAAPSPGGMLQGAAERLPAVWLIVAVAFLVVAAAPRFIGLVWVALGVCVFLSMFGESLQLPGWAMALSPFHSFNGGPILVLTALALASSLGGLKTFNHRDIQA